MKKKKSIPRFQLAASLVSQPVRAGKFSNSHVLIPDWIALVASRFAPIHPSFKAGGVLCEVRTSLRGESKINF
jgi:hypothetical protein